MIRMETLNLLAPLRLLVLNKRITFDAKKYRLQPGNLGVKEPQRQQTPCQRLAFMLRMAPLNR